MRKPIIAGNWKMNNTVAAGTALVKELAPLVKDNNAVDIVVCPTFTALAAVCEAAKGTNIHVGAQNVHWEKSGAFTGEISAEMLTELGVEYVVIGHSERREMFGETDEYVNKRAKAALAAGITPIICCGETLETREAGTTNDFVSGQIKAALEGLTAQQVASLVIAYEPIWLSVLVKLLHLNRLKKFALAFVKLLKLCLMKLLAMLFVFNMAEV